MQRLSVPQIGWCNTSENYVSCSWRLEKEASVFIVTIVYSICLIRARNVACRCRVQHLCAFKIVVVLIYHLLPKVWKVSYTISASIFVDVPYWPPYSMNKFISCVTLDPLQWFFHFDNGIIIAWTHIRWELWMFQNLPLPAEQEIRDNSSGVTPCIVIKNDGVLYHQVSPHASCGPWKHSCVLWPHAT